MQKRWRKEIEGPKLAGRRKEEKKEEKKWRDDVSNTHV